VGAELVWNGTDCRELENLFSFCLTYCLLQTKKLAM